MASTVLAYSFLKAAYAEGVRNPVDALAPLIKRALMKAGGGPIDQANVQKRIKASLGLEIPLNVIRYTFPRLAAQAILKLDERHRYRLVDPDYSDPEILELDRLSRECYQRLKGVITRFLLDNDVTEWNADSFLEDWLDVSALSFLGNINPAYNAQNKDRELNRWGLSP